MKSPKDNLASRQHHLFNQPKNDRMSFSELPQYYAIKRFLYRLSPSIHTNRFVVKGALVLRIMITGEPTTYHAIY